MTRAESAAYTMFLPKDLRDRARAVAKRLNLSMVDIFRLGIDEKVVALEARFRREEEERLTARHVRRESKLGRLSAMNNHSDDTASSTTLKSTHLEALYASLAREISRAATEEEMRNHVGRAVAIVKREKPLTHPPEQQILEELERRVITLRRDAADSARTYDNFVGLKINPEALSK